MFFEGQTETQPDLITMNDRDRNSRPNNSDSTIGNHPLVSPAAADATAFDKERLAGIRQELAANQPHLPARIAATVEEDYQQLLKDFGLH